MTKIKIGAAIVLLSTLNVQGVMADTADTQTVIVPASATSGDFVEAYTIESPSVIRFAATGTISSGKVKNISPKGKDRDLTTCQDDAIPCHPLPYHKDSGADFKIVPDFGALVGYFVANSNNAKSAYYIGSDSVFVASEPGIFFLGINENDPSDNKGKFTVKLTSRPGTEITSDAAVTTTDTSVEPNTNATLADYYKTKLVGKAGGKGG